MNGYFGKIEDESYRSRVAVLSAGSLTVGDFGRSEFVWDALDGLVLSGGS